MQYYVELGNGTELKFYYNDKVYDPNYSSIDTAMVANAFIYGKIRVLDIATGCGFTGLILKHLHPEIDVTCTDIDPEAVRVTKLNAKRLGLDVTVGEADLLPDNKQQYHMITANLPTFDSEQMETEELHGPMTSYYPGTDPLGLYSRLLKEAVGRCVVIVCEVQPKRQADFATLVELNGWKIIVNVGTSFAVTHNEEDAYEKLVNYPKM
jgi:methylase of polypeptide subunit release factors